MRICGVASAFPKNYYSQVVIREALKSRWSDKLERPQILDRLHWKVEVQGRYLVLPSTTYEGGQPFLRLCASSLTRPHESLPPRACTLSLLERHGPDSVPN
jgi:hypothetical protein